MDNNTVAILSKTNELLERYGISPCDVVVTLSDNGDKGSSLIFESPPLEAPSQQTFGRVLAALGMSKHQYRIDGDERDIYTKLQAAVDLAPRSRPRR